MTKLAPEWVRTSDPVIRSPARYRWTTAPALGHRWDRIAMDILDVCDPTPDGYRYILVIADYFSKWTEAFPIKDKCAETVADVLVN